MQSELHTKCNRNGKWRYGESFCVIIALRPHQHAELRRARVLVPKLARAKKSEGRSIVSVVREAKNDDG